MTDHSTRTSGVLGSGSGEGRTDSVASHRLRFTMPRCHRHFFKGHKWWCRKCDMHTEIEMRDVVHELWKLQGAGDRIDHD